MAYRSFREVLAGLTPASIRRLQSIVVTQIPAYLAALDRGLLALLFAAVSTFTAYAAFRQQH
jgi:hypothetical protein